jgi:hypothetical protein
MAFAASSSISRSFLRRSADRCLEPRNRQQPGGNGRSAFELASLTPHIEENLANVILRDLLVAHEPKPGTEHPEMMPSGKAPCMRDGRLRKSWRSGRVRSRRCRTQRPSRKVGRGVLTSGSMQEARFFKSSQHRDWICDAPDKRRVTGKVRRGMRNQRPVPQYVKYFVLTCLWNQSIGHSLASSTGATRRCRGCACLPTRGEPIARSAGVCRCKSKRKPALDRPTPLRKIRSLKAFFVKVRARSIDGGGT